MKLKYWTNFSKRKNSTKQPTGGTEIDVVLKDNTSLLNPTFQTGSVPANVNYCYVADFGRYYHVSGVSHDGPFCLIDCECDVLATYKSQIGATSALIEFTSSSSNVLLPDPRNHPQFDFEEETSTLLELDNNGFSETGSLIIGVAGGSVGVTYYDIPVLQLSNLFDRIFDNSFFTSLENQFFNYKDCIVSLKWVPYQADTGTSTFIKFGGKSLDSTNPPSVSGYPITTRFLHIGETSYDITYPSDSWGLGTTYLDFAPYTTGVIYLPFVGNVPLDVDIVSKSKQITIQADIDTYTADILYKIGNEAGDIIATYQGNCGLDIPISSQSMNALGTISGGISAIGGLAGIGASIAGAALTQNPAVMGAGIAGASASLMSSGWSIAQSGIIHTQTNGSLSSGLSTKLGLKCKASVIQKKPAEDDIDSYQASMGMPYFKCAAISSVSGYVKCSGASVNMPGYQIEKDTVNGYVNGGFYYE